MVTLRTEQNTAVPLPPPELRWGGPRYSDDEIYVRSGLQSVKRLEAECGLTRSSRILDIGCGQGRLLTGLLHRFKTIERYVGIDVHAPSIQWMREHLQPFAPTATFYWLNYNSGRYNKKGGATFDFVLDEKFDCITLFSVFSHMRLRDVVTYLDFIGSVLAKEGKVYLTAFVEDDVEPETENPADYHRLWSGPLHCVRLNRQIFEQHAKESGLQVELFRYRHTNDGQSSYVLSSAGQQFSAKVIVPDVKVVPKAL